MRCARCPRFRAQVPELPEVETIAYDLRPLVAGRTIEAVDLRFPSIVRHPEPEAFVRGLNGQRVVALDRRGKYLIFRLSGAMGHSGHPSVGFADTSPPGGEETSAIAPYRSGEETSALTLVIHLGMTGQLLHKLPGDPDRPHTHVVLSLDNGTELRYSDPRRFGRLLLGTEAELVAARKLPRLGPDPLDPLFTPRDLHRRLSGRRAPLKLLLLDQSILAGIGNIYADEALYRARIRPDRSPARISRARARRLHGALRESLLLGIVNRGSSIDDYVDLYGAKGRQPEELQGDGRGGSAR